jgi:hypothetical protein
MMNFLFFPGSSPGCGYSFFLNVYQCKNVPSMVWTFMTRRIDTWMYTDVGRTSCKVCPGSKSGVNQGPFDGKTWLKAACKVV